ncbi:MAG TPA: peroxidase-related enzyme [Bryobacteraceae bacterium]|nr:peroxidase-related enzyme [Bryobacteraceae bacterium]
MSYFGEVDLDSSRQPVPALRNLFGFVPNLLRAQTLLPRLIEAEAGLAAAILFKEQALSRSQKERIALVASAAHGIGYCFSGHYQTLRSLGSPEEDLDQIVRDHHQAGLSAPDLVLLDFALKLTLSAPWISEEDIAALRESGFTEESILEAILTTALADLLCTLSAGVGPLPDFEPRQIPGSRKEPATDRGSYIGGTAGPYLRTVELTPESFPPFAFFQERFGLIPNLFRAQTLRPDVIEAEAAAVRTILGMDDILSRRQKECILLVSSAAKLNTYCVAAHCEMLRRMGVSKEEAGQIAADHHQAEIAEADKRLLDFALKLTERAREFGREDIELLRRHGFSEAHILEAVATTAFNKFLNTLQMGLGVTPDFEPLRVFGPPETHLSHGADRPTMGVQGDPDVELVAKVQGGDLNSFEELVTRHSRRVYRTLVGIIGDGAEAQDAMQDTFLKAFQHIGKFQGHSKFSTWLVTIAHNTGVQRLRERRPTESLDELTSDSDGDFAPRQVRSWVEDPEQLCSRSQSRALVESALMRLPPKYRVVLVLRDIEQLSGQEAAQALGLGIPAMKARLLRARLMLREALAPHFVSSVKRMGQ